VKPTFLFLIATALISTPAFAGGEECQPICDEFVDAMLPKKEGQENQEVSAMYALKKCGPKPMLPPSSSSSSAPAEAGMGTAPPPPPPTAPPPRRGEAARPDAPAGVGDTWNQCVLDLATHWGMVGPYCAAIEAANDAKGANMAAAALYTLGAVACWVACGSSEGSPWAAAGRAVCGLAALGGIAADITSMAEMGSAGGGGYIAAGVITSLASALGGVVGGAFGSACWGGGIMTASAIAKWLSIALMKDVGTEACKNIKKQGSISDAIGGSSSSSSKGSGGGGSLPGAPGATDGGAGGDTGGGGGGGIAGGTFDDLDDGDTFAQRLGATAGGDPLGRMFNRLENPQKIPDMLKLMGTSASEVARAAVGAGGPSAGLSGIPKLPDSVKDKLGEIEKLVQDEMARSVAAATPSRGGGGAGSGGEPKKESLFGAKMPAAKAGGGKLEFEKQAKKALGEPEGTDIWHEGYAGTIFQIVSTKLVKTRDRVETLEWASPLNRALTGLPSKKAAGRR
jgi:hypothetical protein